MQAAGGDFPSFWIIPSDSSAARSPSLPPQPQGGSSILPSTDISLGAECARRLPPFPEGPGGEGQFSLAPVGRVLGRLSGWEKREGLSEWTPPHCCGDSRGQGRDAGAPLPLLRVSLTLGPTQANLSLLPCAGHLARPGLPRHPSPSMGSSPWNLGEGLVTRAAMPGSLDLKEESHHVARSVLKNVTVDKTGSVETPGPGGS